MYYYNSLSTLAPKGCTVTATSGIFSTIEIAGDHKPSRTVAQQDIYDLENETELNRLKETIQDNIIFLQQIIKDMVEKHGK